MSLQGASLELEKLDPERPEIMQKSLKIPFTCSENISSLLCAKNLVRHRGFRDERQDPFLHQAHSPEGQSE